MTHTNDIVATIPLYIIVLNMLNFNESEEIIGKSKLTMQIVYDDGYQIVHAKLANRLVGQVCLIDPVY